jgi:hypothetical protein
MNARGVSLLSFTQSPKTNTCFAVLRPQLHTTPTPPPALACSQQHTHTHHTHHHYTHHLLGRGMDKHALVGTPGHHVHIALFRNVTNTAEIRARVLSGDLQASFIRAELVCHCTVLFHLKRLHSLARCGLVHSHDSCEIFSLSTHVLVCLAQITGPFHILAVAQQSMSMAVSNTMKTRNVHSELLYRLSPSSSVCMD